MFQPQLINQLLHALPAFMPGDRLRFQYCQYILLNRELAENRCFLGEITDAVLASPQIHRDVSDVLIVEEYPARIGRH